MDQAIIEWFTYNIIVVDEYLNSVSHLDWEDGHHEKLGSSPNVLKMVWVIT